MGTDNTVNRPVLNTDRAGNELRRVDLTEATGIAINPVTRRVCFGTSGLPVTARDLLDPATVLATINPVGTFGEDLAFDGPYLRRADEGGSGKIQKINPADGTVLFEFHPGFSPLGIAWDGTYLWVSEFAIDGLVKQFDTAGNPTGFQFVAPVAGAVLGSFVLPTLDGRFVDGLEFQGASAQAGVPDSPLGSGALRGLSAAPTPFSNSVTFAVQLGRPAVLAVEVFVVKGARIVSLVNGPAGVGSHQFRCDARDSRGTRQPAGIYWVKATVEGRSTSRSVIIVK